jgi:hypothetical protein
MFKMFYPSVSIVKSEIIFSFSEAVVGSAFHGDGGFFGKEPAVRLHFVSQTVLKEEILESARLIVVPDIFWVLLEEISEKRGTEKIFVELLGFDGECIHEEIFIPLDLVDVGIIRGETVIV